MQRHFPAQGAGHGKQGHVVRRGTETPARDDRGRPAAQAGPKDFGDVRRGIRHDVRPLDGAPHSGHLRAEPPGVRAQDLAGQDLGADGNGFNGEQGISPGASGRSGAASLADAPPEAQTDVPGLVLPELEFILKLEGDFMGHAAVALLDEDRVQHGPVFQEHI